MIPQPSAIRLQHGLVGTGHRSPRVRRAWTTRPNSHEESVLIVSATHTTLLAGKMPALPVRCGRPIRDDLTGIPSDAPVSNR